MNQAQDTRNKNPSEADLLRIGRELWALSQKEAPGIFEKDYWHGRLMEWAMKDPTFKLDLFRFVDVLPSLKTTDQVVEHVRQYLIREGRELPAFMSAALKLASSNLTGGVASIGIRKNITDMAGRFIVGTSPEEAIPILRRFHKEGLAFTVDLLGEATVSDAEGAICQQRYMALVEQLSDEAKNWPSKELLDRNHLGEIPRTNVSLKISAMDPQLNPADPSGSVARLKARVLPLFLRAKEKNVFINMDLEQWDFHEIIFDLFEEIACHPQVRNWPHVGIVVQAYLKSSRADVDRLVSIAASRGSPVTVRLVKGAYWDFEVVHSRQQGLACPVFTDKAATDANYESLTTHLFQNIDRLHPAFGSHNLRSISHAIACAETHKLPRSAYEVQMLHGMAEPERKALRSLGHRVRLYCPVGEMLPGMAYLVRRLLENTSNNGFLRMNYHDKVDINQLLASPEAKADRDEAHAMIAGDLKSPFENCPMLDFTNAQVRKTFQQSLDEVAAQFPIHVPIVISGKEVSSREQLARECPSDKRRNVAAISLASRAQVEIAVTAALKAWPEWRDRPLDERALLLEKLADRIEADRISLAALQCFEVGKPWREADADVAEAIDFCRYYARQALKELAPHAVGTMLGEDNLLSCEGRGPTAVIGPWNFPLAILCGMSVAALVAGNPVLIKPAEQSSATAFRLHQLMRESGFPSDVIHFLPGVGEEIGVCLVQHPSVAQIAFTGSKGVGLSIVEEAAKTQRGQPQVKRVICEMGGKNAIIVDDDADFDQAVSGIVQSAFGYAGQKCSACSRVIVVGDVYKLFTERLVEATRSIVVDAAHKPGCFLGPVVDEAAWDRLKGVIQNPGAGAEPLYVGGPMPPEGWFVPPAIFSIHDPAHRLFQDEFFGPIVAVLQVKTFEEALKQGVNTEFALTGAVYSRNPRHLDEARKAFRVGNLYLNRGSTGAMVNRQPFGGFRMSGLGSKAGGPGYLSHFCDPRCITENTMRCGFTTDLS